MKYKKLKLQKGTSPPPKAGVGDVIDITEVARKVVCVGQHWLFQTAMIIDDLYGLNLDISVFLFA